MGLLCFLILINDVITNTPSLWKYVNDSTVGSTINSEDPDSSQLHSTLRNLQDRTRHNKMTVNQNKTDSPYAHHHLHSSFPPPAISMNGIPLRMVETTKPLGITTTSTSYQLYLLRQLKSMGTPSRELVGVYTTFILPKLTYASLAWYPLSTLPSDDSSRASKSVPVNLY